MKRPQTGTQKIPVTAAPDCDQSAERFRQTLRANPNDDTARLNLAICYEKHSRWEEAAREWMHWLEIEPHRQEAHLGLGLCLLQTKRPVEALEHFDLVLREQTGNEVALAGKQAALRMVALTRKPTVPPTAVDTVSIPDLEAAAAAALAASDYETLRRHCARLTHLDPAHFEAWLNLGVANQQTGALEDAVFAYRRALQLQPDAYQPHLNLAIVRHASGDLAGAREAYQQALRRAPDLETALWNCALVCEQSGDTEAAERHLTQLTEVNPQWSEAWFRLGFVRLRRADYAGSVRAWEECLAQRDPWPEVTLNLAIARFNLGDTSGAREAFEAALSLQSGSVAALRGLAAACMAEEEWDRVASLRVRLLEFGEACPEITFNLALRNHDAGRYEEALDLYRAALQEWPEFPEALLNLGCLLSDMGDPAGAAESWRMALELKPELADCTF